MRKATIPLLLVMFGCVAGVLAWWFAWRVPAKSRPERYRITQGSMAPHLIGESAEIECQSCGLRWLINATDAPAVESSPCRHCAAIRLRVIDQRRGEVVRLRPYDRQHQPAAGQVALIQRTAGDIPPRTVAKRIVAKRIAALPGQTVDIRDGDIWIDGSIRRKDLNQFKRQAIHVLDTAELNTAELSGGFQAVCRTAEDQWSVQSDLIQFQGTDSSECVSFLEFTADVSRHVVGARRDALYDDYAYNLSMSRPLHVCHDVVVAVDIDELSAEYVATRVATDSACWTWTLDRASRTLIFSRAGQPPARWRVPTLTLPATLLFGYWDGQLGWAWQSSTPGSSIDRQPPNYQQYAAVPASLRPVGQTPRLAMGLRRGAATIHRIRLLRDIYHTDGRTSGPTIRLPTTLPPGEFFVLGDNSPQSIDSRHRRFGSVGTGELMGTLRREPGLPGE